MKAVCVVLALACCLLLAPFAAAQEQAGSIEGVVKDSSGAVLPGVTVEARNAAISGVQTAVTDAQGAYRFPALPPGTYEVTATLQGFTSAKISNVRVALGQLLKVELTMSVGGVTETVQVKGEAPLIDTKQNASFATVQRDIIDRIPRGRDFTSVIQTAPGAQNEARAGGTQIDGASGSENRFIVDGMDTTNLQNGTSGKFVPIDFIQEVQVKSSGYNAEFGGATGGVVSAITRSGSNQMRGSLGTYFQNDKMLGPVRKTNAGYNPWSTNTADWNNTPYRAAFNSLQPLGDLGGPVLKDRVWYYGGVSFTSDTFQQDTIFIGDPTYTKRHFTQTNYNVYPNYNVTTQLSKDVRLRVSGSNQWSRTRGALPANEPMGRLYLGQDANLYGKDMYGYSRNTFDLTSDGKMDQAAFDRRWALNGNDARNHMVSGNLDWVITSSFFVNATAGMFYTNGWTPAEARGNELIHTFNGTNSDTTMTQNKYPTVPGSFQQATGYSDRISTNGTLRNKFDRVYFNANTIWYKPWLGQHVFKAGMRYERFGNDVMSGNTQPTVTLFWGQAYSTAEGGAATGTYGYYQVNKTGTIGAVHSNNYSVWVQDSWSLNNRMTINAGVRAENENVPSYKKTADAININFGFRDKIAPRIGFAYDVNGDSKWKLYGSFGFFYDITKLELPRSAFGGDHWVNYYWTLDTYDWKSINCDEGNTGCPGRFIEAWDARRSSNQPDPDLAAYFNRPGMTGIDPALKPVQTGEFVLGGDHELNATMSFGIRYKHGWLTRTVEDVGLLLNANEVYIIGNPGFGYTEVMSMEFPQFKTPKATRDYDSVEFRLRRRLANRWSADISYTYSRLWGNYGGLASSDENGRLSPNVNRYYDAPYMSYDDKQREVFGLLPTDRPHVFKVQSTYDLPWGTTIGGYFIGESGTPQTSQVNWKGYPVYFNGRGDLGRTPIFKQADLNIQHDFRLSGTKRLSVQATILNVFDWKTPTNYTSSLIFREKITTKSEAEFYAAPWDPYVVAAQKRAEGATIRPQQYFKALDTLQAPRDIRVSVKYSF